ncbi:S1 family peptidase [Promicromonospora panici]|uniref:S1 family peptidase n=1 Tax=Promicromonospora panici TaxID=2219658 RepID=UPI00101C405E|nr:S1 family peptidase [Promicromonospora panici]
MRRLPSKPRRYAPRAQLIALAAGVGLTMSALAGPPAAAEPDGPTSAELAEVNAAVDDAAGPGVAWYTDAAAGTVVVTVDSTVSAAERDTIRAAAGDVPGSLTIKRADGVFTPLLGPGDAIHGPDVWCSAGFNAGDDGEGYLITAGHCGDKASTWYADSDETVPVGRTVDSAYPGNDYALVRYDSGLERPGGYSAGVAHVGQSVTRDGAASGEHTGTVTARDVTVRYAGDVTMREMIQADVCAEPGDSGGALYDGSTALGITSGGSGDCPGEGTTFYQPILEALHEYGVRLY